MPDLQWVLSGYMISVACTFIAAGRLGDIFGRRLALLAGVGMFGLTDAWTPFLIALLAAGLGLGLGFAYARWDERPGRCPRHDLTRGATHQAGREMTAVTGWTMNEKSAA